MVATKNDPDKSTEILAAVGAGLVPATMAFLVPMIMGRKRRSADDHPITNEIQTNTYNPIVQPM